MKDETDNVKAFPSTAIEPKETAAEPEPKQVMFQMATLLAIYMNGDQQKQRHMNIIFESFNLNISQAHLAQVQQGAMARLNAENGVESDKMMDMIILGVSPLGYMTPEEFHNIPQTGESIPPTTEG